jgi:CRP-like cAMP-binding protein
LFVELSPDDLKGIAAITGEQVFSDGEIISEQGEMGDEMYIIVSGEVRVIVEGEGQSQQEIVRRQTGEIVGEMSILDQSPRMASLVAAGDVRVLCIAQPDFEEILRLRPETSLAVMRVLCDRLREREHQA